MMEEDNILDREDIRPKKKKKQSHNFNTHPNGVLPLGNMYTGSSNCRLDSLGLLCAFTDDTIIEIFGMLSPKSLVTISEASKVCFLFASVETLWKDLYFADYPSQIKFHKTWKLSYIYQRTSEKRESVIDFKVNGFYSDTMYNEWYLPTLDPLQWNNGTDNIQRVKDLSLEDFKTNFEAPAIPCVITDIIPKWPAFTKWTREYLIEQYGETFFQADSKVSYKLGDYLDYCDQTIDERPIYLFASDFAKQAPQMEKEYDVPIYFQNDYFNLIENKRPNFRWLLVGPTRAGATFHKDPNWTSAWNALISGKKKWIFYPPDVTPLGVIEEEGGLAVTVPSTLIQWFNDFYAKKHVKRIEFIQNPGDLVYVPSGWWHQVINLETSVAITHNFVNDSNLKNTYTFLKTKESLALFDEFSRVLKEHHPQTYEDLLNSCNEKNWEEACGNDCDFIL